MTTNITNDQLKGAFYSIIDDLDQDARQRLLAYMGVHCPLIPDFRRTTTFDTIEEKQSADEIFGACTDPAGNVMPAQTIFGWRDDSIKYRKLMETIAPHMPDSAPSDPTDWSSELPDMPPTTTAPAIPPVSVLFEDPAQAVVPDSSHKDEKHGNRRRGRTFAAKVAAAPVRGVAGLTGYPLGDGKNDSNGQ